MNQVMVTELSRLSRSTKDLRELDEKASDLTTAKKQKIVSSLVDRIEIFPERLEIHYGLGRSKIKRELVYANSRFILPVDGSTSLTYGGDKQDRTADLLHAMQALSQLSYTPKLKSFVGIKILFGFCRDNRFLTENRNFSCATVSDNGHTEFSVGVSDRIV